MDMLQSFIEGFIKGCKETPKAYFAPAIALWTLLFEATESLIFHHNNQDSQK
jgi:hypothetical protein